ncbi:NAD(P)H-dependent oxidoreductase [Anaerobacillus alkaliphilus]|uniref:NAD(P)H-dependent oxidoreductase n=1 Tax=Anaerobacillus alkaliphilus TaxID=1548597 RepID=A0A4Q0VSQ2_9BACI|nr:NADPH-dependent FMN reductase [Anaerobacillus alkaliphilus]RXJ00376.1 NAD(P)H-dependent oxidoreductase [Anaerobacillus alkaliphilus]
MKVVALVGSTRRNSTTRKATEIVVKEIERHGGCVEIIHFKDVKLPMYDGDLKKENYPKEIMSFINKVASADGVILASPEYHGSLSGVLKNALDYLGAREMSGKIAGILTTAGSKLGAANTVNTLHQICRNLHAWALPQSPSVPAAYEAFDENGSLKDKKLQERLESLGRTLVREIKSRK